MIYIIEREISEYTDYVLENYSSLIYLGHLEHALENDDDEDENDKYTFIVFGIKGYWYERYCNDEAIDDTDYIVMG